MFVFGCFGILDWITNPVGSLIGSIAGTGASAIGQYQANKLTREENQKNRDWNEKMWNLSNEYNKPINQMARLEEAGLNPNLVYGQGTSTLSSYAGNLGTSNNFKNPLGNVDLGINVAHQLANQNKLVESEIKVNEAKESNLIADAENKRSQIPANLSQNRLYQAITQNEKNKDAWFDLSLPVQTEILNFDLALKSDNHEYMIQAIKGLMQSTDNNKRLTDMRITAMAEGLAQAWKSLQLSERELAGKLALWAKEGDAAVRNSKANMLNALTNGKWYDLAETKQGKLLDKQVELLEGQISKLRTFNGWYDLLLQRQVEMLGGNIENVNSRTESIDLQNTYFDYNLLMPLLDPMNYFKKF